MSFLVSDWKSAVGLSKCLEVSKASELLWQVEVSAGALPPVAIAVPWGSGEACRRGACVGEV